MSVIPGESPGLLSDLQWFAEDGETRETRGLGPGVLAPGPDACWIVSPGRGIGAVAQSTSSEADGGGVAEPPQLTY